MQEITVTCMGQTKRWTDKEQALAYYNRFLLLTKGIEQLRYLKVINELNEGKTVCTDNEV